MARPGTVVTIESTNDGGYFIRTNEPIHGASAHVAKDFGHALDRLYQAFDEDHATPDPKAAEAVAKVEDLFGPQLKALDKTLNAAFPHIFPDASNKPAPISALLNPAMSAQRNMARSLTAPRAKSKARAGARKR